MFSLEEIRWALAAHQPVVLPVEGRSRAAVAVVLRQPGGAPELLFIERATRRGDPWSGHMAFPGGWVDPGDGGPRTAAERETLEEVGVELTGAQFLGRLDDLKGWQAAGSGGLVVSAFVFRVEGTEPLAPNHEVRKAFWVPVAALVDPRRQVDYPVRLGPGVLYPGIVVGEPKRHVVWGLTYRFLEGFLRIIGRPLPERPIRAGDAADRGEVG